MLLNAPGKLSRVADLSLNDPYLVHFAFDRHIKIKTAGAVSSLTTRRQYYTATMSDDDTYEIPLQDQRVFGAGIKRKRVKFVPSTPSVAPPPNKRPATSVSDFYLKLVLPDEQVSATEVSTSTTSLPSSSSKGLRPTDNSAALPLEPAKPQVCEICNLPPLDKELLVPFQEDDSSSCMTGTLDQRLPPKPRPHEASLVHQVCLTHSHPPSHLDRNRKGLAYLSSYGWDPDSRLGLGASGQGIQYPIKTKPKDDKLGIGVVLPKEADRRRKEKTEKLDAGKVRKLNEKDRKKAERLREMFYRNDDVERYLGGG